MLHVSLFFGLFAPTSELRTLWLAPPAPTCEASLDLFVLTSERSRLRVTEGDFSKRSPVARWLPPPLIRLVIFSAFAAIIDSVALCYELTRSFKTSVAFFS